MKSIKVVIAHFVLGITILSCSSRLVIPNIPTSASDTSTPTQSPTKTITPIPLPTHTPSPTIAWTPLPSIPPNEFPEAWLNLLKSNMGCNLPCWWGIVPGKTTIAEAFQFLNQFPFSIGEVRTQSKYYKGVSHKVSAFGLSVNLLGKLVGTVDLHSTDEVIDTIFIHLEGDHDNYQINQILTSFGRPSEIYISSQASSPESRLAPTILILDYREKGILVWYDYLTFSAGENLQICFNSEKTTLELWDPQFDVYRIPTDEYLTMITDWPPKRLADVTSFDLDSFYDTFAGNATGKCFETPANSWP